VMGSAVFSTLSLVIACFVKSHERIMGKGQVMTMPLFFASNAIYPIVLMPMWLRSIASVNPLTYEVDGLRALMVQGGTSTLGLGVDFGVLLAFVTVLVVVATRLYPRLVT
jgi:ABC-2 type transport system permease protein